jgi:hypothetical protein
LTLFDQLGFSSKTPRESEPEDDTSSSGIWWRSDTPGAMEPLPRLMSGHRIDAIGGGALRDVPTPTVCGNYNRKGASKTSGDGLETWVNIFPTPTVCGRDNAGGSKPGPTRPSLQTMAAKNRWPTPLASDWKSQSPAKQATNSRPLWEQIGASDGGPLNPAWVEWLMGWPIGHTESKLWATARSRSARRSRGDCSEDRKC